MSLRTEAIELLREFANFQSQGMRGVVRMLRMQEDARLLLQKIDIRSGRKEQV